MCIGIYPIIPPFMCHYSTCRYNELDNFKLTQQTSAKKTPKVPPKLEIKSRSEKVVLRF